MGRRDAGPYASVVILSRYAKNLVSHIFILRYWRSFASLRMTNYPHKPQFKRTKPGEKFTEMQPRCKAKPPVNIQFAGGFAYFDNALISLLVWNTSANK